MDFQFTKVPIETRVRIKSQVGWLVGWVMSYDPWTAINILSFRVIRYNGKIVVAAIIISSVMHACDGGCMFVFDSL